VVTEAIVDPCVVIRSPMVNTGHCVALLALPFDALAIKNDLERILNDVERARVVKLDFQLAYNDRD
jgi:hypothetical protein